MSYQTTMARADAAAWETEWRRHRLGCPVCSAAATARRWHALCPAGAAVHASRAEATAAVRHERELDRRPAPGQGTLWDDDGGGDDPT